MRKRRILGMALAAAGCLAMMAMGPLPARAHCDTMDGPVVKAAKAALEKGDVTPVLKWVKKGDEAAIRGAFKRTLTVRGKGPDARELADMYFFETLVRLHRAGEGAAYEGLKPSGMEIEPPVAAADRALDGGSADDAVKMVTAVMTEGLRHRFADAAAKKKHMDESVEAGRNYVEAYVEFVHYMEALYAAAIGRASGHSGESSKVK